MEAGIGRPRGAALDARGGSRQAPSTMRWFGRPKNGVPMQGNAGDAGDESDPGGFFFWPLFHVFSHFELHFAIFGHFWSLLPVLPFGHLWPF